MKILLLSILLINFGFMQSHWCGADKIKLNPKPIKLKQVKKNSNSNLKTNADSYRPLTIGYDFSTLQKPSSMSSSTFNNIKTKLKEVAQEFSKFLQFQHVDINLYGLKDEIMKMCDLNVIGQDYGNFLLRNDIIIFPEFDSTLSSSTIAAAGACLISEENFQPFGGVLYINPNINFNLRNVDYYMKNILLHEITHVLVFSPYIFENLHLNRTINGMSYIISKNVVTQAQKHFDCNSLIGVPLENQGGTGSAGSHWESRYMLGDYMVSTDFPDSAISDITLALFEDSGFYKVNYYSGGLFKFGKGAGCRFFNDKCVLNDEAQFTDFCAVSSKPLCSSSRALKSSCFMGRYPSIPYKYAYFSDKNIGGYSNANYCPVAYETHPDNDYFPKHCQFGSESSNYGEKLGPNSFCFMSSIVDGSSNDSDDKPVCYEIECDRSNKKIIVKIGSSSVECPNGGGSVNAPSGMKGTIDCPEYSDLCSSNDIVCNDMYSCFTKIAENEKYNYDTSPYNYEGPTYTSDTKDEYIEPIRRSESFNLRMNLLLIAAICLFSLI